MTATLLADPLRTHRLTLRNGVVVNAVTPHEARRYAADAARAAYERASKARTRWGLLFRLSSLWIGVHYSPFNRRWCINLVPCVTLWIALPGGNTP